MFPILLFNLDNTLFTYIGLVFKVRWDILVLIMLIILFYKMLTPKIKKGLINI